MFGSRPTHLLAGLSLVAASMSITPVVAQSSPLSVIQSSDGTLYLEQGSNAWTMVPNSISDADLVTLTPSGELDGAIGRSTSVAPDRRAFVIRCSRISSSSEQL